MPTPYLAPLKAWIVDVLEDREKNPQDTSLKMPWATLISGAKVVKGHVEKEPIERIKQFKDIVSGKNTTSSIVYKGCIIKNNLGIDSNYSIGKTVAGIDFDGKPIEVIGETNRRVSMPIIESIDIDTDGANNTLKSAKVNVRCFTLKQFEMFELFFCKPGMNVLLEFGDNTLDRKKYTNTTTKETGLQYFTKSSETGSKIKKENYDTFIEEYSEYYRFNSNTIAEYLSHIQQTRGTYDFMAGKVTDYRFSIDANGTYSVMVEISQANQMSYNVPTILQSKDSAVAQQDVKNLNTFTQWKSQLIADLRLNKEKVDNIKFTEELWKDHFFNWSKVSDTKGQEVASAQKYISLHFILEILLNYVVNDYGEFAPQTDPKPDEIFEIPNYPSLAEPTNKNKNVKIIPIAIHPSMISSSEDVIFPNSKLPIFESPLEKNSEQDIVQPNIKGSVDGTIGVTTKLDIIAKTPIGTLIKGTGELSEHTQINPDVIDDTGKVITTNGNALNIFIRYEKVVEIWKKSTTRLTFIEGVLNTINENSYGRFRLVLAAPDMVHKSTVIDLKSTNSIDPAKNIPYRFKPGTINSNVKAFSFNFEMSNLVAARTVFNSKRLLSDAFKQDPAKRDNDTWLLPDNIYKSYDASMQGNADGFYALNMVDIKAVSKIYTKAVNETKVAKKQEDKATPNEAKNLNDIIQSKCVHFKMADGTVKTLIYKDNTFIRDITKSKDSDPVTTLTPIDVELTIDGMSGFSCGEYFRIDGVPEIYNQIGVFTITNVKHKIEPAGWTTTIDAGFRIVRKR